MPLSNSIGGGILPAAGSAALAELNAITYGAVIPSMIVQIGNSTPVMAALFANAKTHTGGVSGIIQPVQGKRMTTPQWSGTSGNFSQPTNAQGIQNLEWNPKLMICPIGLLGTELLAQQDAAVVRLADARCNDAMLAKRDMFTTALYNNYSDSTAMIGFPGAIDDGTTLDNYGGLSRATNTWLKSTLAAAGTTAPTRALVMQYFIGVYAGSGGEWPDMAVLGPKTWMKLAQDYLGLESYKITPGSAFADGEESRPRAGFMALDVAGVPVYMDINCPEGTMWIINNDYLQLYVTQGVCFSFTGFESLLPSYQFGYVGAVMTAAELVCNKPNAQGKVTGFTSVS